MLDARAFIRDKREGRVHAAADVGAFIAAYVRDEVPDYQASAWLMAAFLRGLDETETDALTRALIGSGRVFDWSDLGRPSADKHSTGGVGDKVSLVLAPLVAACGVLVPMVSGRGLGHTGGTLDKLEAIPGFRIQLGPEALRTQLTTLGVVMVGQGPDLAPADGRLYALRDVTSTVECEPFIVSSIVSKKIAEGAEAVVYDVKCGNGAFMKSEESALRLARRLVETTERMGRKSAALVTDMSQPLGRAAGNVLEVRESVDVLQGRGPADVRELTLELAALMLSRSGAEKDPAAARRRVEQALDSGSAWEKFLRLVEAQGGDPKRLQGPDGLPGAPVVLPIAAPREGYVAAVDTFRLGELIVAMGGGRVAKEDAVDPRVGLLIHARIGERVVAGDRLAEIHLATDEPELTRRAAECFEIREQPSAGPELILHRVE
ncbi:MAG TPA: thymidine phosphorylase, partial [Candidatus Limnocylindria bacterium]|nr:thymidine phosphorylase [Candidatus Limnocylindria bacterium]